MRFAEVRWSSAEERQLFVDEAGELLDALEQGVLQSPPPLEELFRAAHTLKGSAAMVGLEAWAQAAHALEDALDEVRQGRATLDPALQAQVLQTVDRIRAELRGQGAPAPAEGLPNPQPSAATPGETTLWTLHWAPGTPLVGARAYQAWEAVNRLAPGTVCMPAPEALPTWEGVQSQLRVPEGTDPAAVRRALEAIPDLAAVEVAAAPVPPDAAPAGARSLGPAPPPEPPAAEHSPTIRIPAQTLDRMLEGLGELLLDHGQIAHHWAGADATRAGVLEHLRRRILELQDLALRARMLPLDALFRQYPRAVHDLAQRLGKAIRLQTEGGETELDRLVMDRLHEPLLHLLRNACDHGIEPPELRRAAGKESVGTLRLQAWAGQGHVHIALSDDGAGIDWERLRQRAVVRGWLTPEAAAAAGPEQLTELLFRPGVSTAERVSELSGRGVGLDVVRTFLDSVHGTVSVESTPGQGTRFQLELPMTLALMTALLVDAGPWTVGLPVPAVERIEEIGAAGLSQALGCAAVPEGNDPLPVWSLATLLDPQVQVDNRFLVRVRDGRVHAALGVEGVRGQQEVVVKPLATLGAAAPWLSGVALLGDGRLALMVDVRRLVPGGGTEGGPRRQDSVLRPGSNQMELLVFRLSDGQRYGINVYKTREVLAGGSVTPVADQHPWVQGFLRLRGQIVPVLSLHRALGLSEAGAAPLTLITEFNQSVQAFPVDAVERMVRVSWGAVAPLPPALGSDGPERRLTGLIDHPELGPVQLIDFEQILARVVPPRFPEEAAPAPDTAGRPVWLADDSRVARQQVERALAPLGVRVRSFTDGQQLWEAVEAGQGLPQLFVLDVEMPRLDGYTLAQRLKGTPATASLPIILHTSLSGHWHAERAQQVQVDAIVTKFDPVFLAQTVRALVVRGEGG